MTRKRKTKKEEVKSNPMLKVMLGLDEVVISKRQVIILKALRDLKSSTADPVVSMTKIDKNIVQNAFRALAKRGYAKKTIQHGVYGITKLGEQLCDAVDGK